MTIDDDLRMREWSRLKYFEPRRTLLDLRAIELQIADADIDERVRSLRTAPLRKYHEWRQAALFCYGLSQVLGTTVYFAHYEASGYDYVTMRLSGDVQTFTPLQLKELVPTALNPLATLPQLLAGLAKYPDSTDTAVAIHLNRRDSMDPGTIAVPTLRIGELWLFWASSDDGSRWSLYGDLLKTPALDEFVYPS